ncbi:MAG: DUF4389 domain-containing protein [Candidatus Micrarchaeia archaeon]
METVKLEVSYAEPASRLELIIRFLWAIPLYIVTAVLGFVGWVCFVIQWLHILLLAKRNATLHKFITLYITYAYKFITYILLGTDERPPIIPEGV